MHVNHCTNCRDGWQYFCLLLLLQCSTGLDMVLENYWLQSWSRKGEDVWSKRCVFRYHATTRAGGTAAASSSGQGTHRGLQQNDDPRALQIQDKKTPPDSHKLALLSVSPERLGRLLSLRVHRARPRSQTRRLGSHARHPQPQSSAIPKERIHFQFYPAGWGEQFNITVLVLQNASTTARDLTAAVRLFW